MEKRRRIRKSSQREDRFFHPSRWRQTNRFHIGSLVTPISRGGNKKSDGPAPWRAVALGLDWSRPKRIFNRKWLLNRWASDHEFTGKQVQRRVRINRLSSEPAHKLMNQK